MASKRGRKSNPQLEELREQIRREHRRATAKISRNRRGKGVELFNSSLDPRVNAAKIGKYTGAQLQAYGERLREFNSRKTQFLAGADGTALPRDRYAVYQRLREENNRRVQERMSGRASLKAPGSGMTIEERDREVRSRKRARGSVKNRVIDIEEHEAFEINGLAGLDRLIKDMRKRNKRDYIPETLKAQRGQLADMLTTIGNHDLIERADKLTNHQFDVLFNDTNFADTVSLKYSILQAISNGITKPSDATQIENATHDINEFFKWAEDEVPRESPRGRK